MNFIKLALSAAGLKTQTKVQMHFAEEKPDWRAFEKNLHSGNFRQAVLKAEQSDPVLKKYVKNYGGYVASKDVVAEIRSKDSGRVYKIKDLHTGRLGCNCGHWQYVGSVSGKDCKHIRSVKQSKMVKLGAKGVTDSTFRRNGPPHRGVRPASLPAR